MKKIIGYNFLHSHPNLEKALELNPNHSIVDSEDYNLVINFFRNNPIIFEDMLTFKDKELF
jgi:hypothetical protein